MVEGVDVWKKDGEEWAPAPFASDSLKEREDHF
jgi:hypothetical protein